MKKLDHKIILHIPVHKFENNKITEINMERYLNILIETLNNNGYTSFYKTSVTGYYKNRSFDELLITIFTTRDDTKAIIIFKEWFETNNNALKQESFAYEDNNILYIEELNV